uniref:Bestrophin homolog n=1 Tax=Syphacia muris TaxID=451379 RepID=A0A0N5ABM0_9BILA
MTVTYTGDVSNCSLKAFGKTLFRWRGSLWKSVYWELLIWCIAYATVFEDVCALCYKYAEYIPLTFMLGFYVQQVINRWTDMFNNMGWCDNFSLYVSSYIQGTSLRARMMKRNVARYMILMQTLVYRDISIKVRRRFPTPESLVAAGFINETEKTLLDETETPHKKYWVPVRWAMAIIRQARSEGLVTNDFAVQDMYKKLLDFRTNLQTVSLYDWVPLPLVYTQVVFLTVRLYFTIALLGRQYLVSNRYKDLKGPLDAYVPIMTMIQFVFYVGWMKVAEALLNPYGDDDDDFEVNWAIDRNLQVSLKIVDENPGFVPAVVKDKFWHDTVPEPLYSPETANIPHHPPVGSAVGLVPPTDVIMVPRVNADGESVSSASNANPIFVRSMSAVSNRSDGSFIGNTFRRLSRLTSRPQISPLPEFTRRQSQLEDDEFIRQMAFGGNFFYPIAFLASFLFILLVYY